MTQKMNSFLQQFLLDKPIDIVVDNAQIPSAWQLEIAFESSCENKNNTTTKARRGRLSPSLSSPPKSGSKSGSKSCDRSRWSASVSSRSSDKSSSPPRLPIHMSSTKKTAVDDVPPPVPLVVVVVLPLPKAASSFEESPRQQSSERRSDTCANHCAPLPIDTQLVMKNSSSHLRRGGGSSLEFLVEAIVANDSSAAVRSAAHLSPHDITHHVKRQSRMLSVDAAFQERSDKSQN
jgi:hypothetical protein